VTNVTRSVERIDGVKEVDFDLNTGRGSVRYKPGRKPNPTELWEAVKRSGFTPERVDIGGVIYEGS